MSIIQELYTIFEKEYSKHLQRKSSKNKLLIELSRNLGFIHEGLKENLSASVIIKGLEETQYHVANNRALDLNSIQKKTLSSTTYGGIAEFGKYQSWSTKKLIDKVYERISVLKKLNLKAEKVDINKRLQNLFKLHMLLAAHIDGKQLKLQKRSARK